MTEWLLSGQNTQESMTIARPLTATAVEANLNISVGWTLEELAGNTSDFDATLAPCAVVQGWTFLNISHFTRNAARVVPFDVASVGVPQELAPEMAKAPLGRSLRMPWRFYQLYKWADKFYKTQLPGFAEDTHRVYWEVREAGDFDPALIWPIFEEGFAERLITDARAHGVASTLVTVLDGVIRQKAPALIDLFAGQSTATSLIGQGIWELSQTAERCGPVVVQQLWDGVTDLDAYAALPSAAPFVEEVQAFLRRYGHRGFRYELDFAAERLADHPAHTMMAIANQLRKHQSPHARAEKARQRGQAALAAMNSLQRGIWTRVLRWGQNLIAWREASKSYTALHHALYGLVARQLSEKFYPDADEPLLWYTTFEEFLAFGRSRGRQRIAVEVLENRRAEFERQFSQQPLPDLIWFNPETRHWRPALAERAETGASAPTHYQGIPACGGAGPVEGIALVTNDPLDAGRRLLELGENVILVTRLTDPAWSSLFARLSGVITELGGVISHASIVARENGLPAVVGVADITTAVRNGQRLRLDGVTGEIEVLA